MCWRQSTDLLISQRDDRLSWWLLLLVLLLVLLLDQDPEEKPEEMTTRQGSSPVVDRMSWNITPILVTAIYSSSVKRITVFREREGSVQ